MNIRRVILCLFTFALLVPLAGCGHHKHCCGDTRSFAPPPSPCCDKGLPPGVIPSPNP